MSTPSMVNENLGNETRITLDSLISQMEQMPIGLPLVWLYVWDVIKNKYESYSVDSGEYYVVNPDFNIDNVWDALWNKPEFTLEYGPEALDEHVFDWLMDNNFIIEDGEDEDEQIKETSNGI